MLEKYKNFLVVAAHPDDEVLGCGGTLKKLSKLEKKIKVITIAEGSSCRFNNQIKFKNQIQKIINLRKKYTSKALADLSVKNFDFYDLKCGQLNSYPIIQIAKIIEKEIKKFKPQVIFTHSNNDVNIDHRTVHQACLQATRPTKIENKIDGLISFEILSSTEWNYSKIFEPNYFVNIDREIASKISALKKYKSEIKKFPHPRSAEGINVLAKYRGMQSHNKFAEAFNIVRLFS